MSLMANWSTEIHWSRQFRNG